MPDSVMDTVPSSPEDNAAEMRANLEHVCVQLQKIHSGGEEYFKEEIEAISNFTVALYKDLQIMLNESSSEEFTPEIFGKRAKLARKIVISVLIQCQEITGNIHTYRLNDTDLNIVADILKLIEGIKDNLLELRDQIDRANEEPPRETDLTAAEVKTGTEWTTGEFNRLLDEGGTAAVLWAIQRRTELIHNAEQNIQTLSPEELKKLNKRKLEHRVLSELVESAPPMELDAETIAALDREFNELAYGVPGGLVPRCVDNARHSYKIHKLQEDIQHAKATYSDTAPISTTDIITAKPYKVLEVDLMNAHIQQKLDALLIEAQATIEITLPDDDRRLVAARNEAHTESIAAVTLLINPLDTDLARIAFKPYELTQQATKVRATAALLPTPQEVSDQLHDDIADLPPTDSEINALVEQSIEHEVLAAKAAELEALLPRRLETAKRHVLRQFNKNRGPRYAEAQQLGQETAERLIQNHIDINATPLKFDLNALHQELISTHTPSSDSELETFLDDLTTGLLTTPQRYTDDAENFRLLQQAIEAKQNSIIIAKALEAVNTQIQEKITELRQKVSAEAVTEAVAALSPTEMRAYIDTESFPPIYRVSELLDMKSVHEIDFPADPANIPTYEQFLRELSISNTDLSYNDAFITATLIETANFYKSLEIKQELSQIKENRLRSITKDGDMMHLRTLPSPDDTTKTRNQIAHEKTLQENGRQAEERDFNKFRKEYQFIQAHERLEGLKSALADALAELPGSKATAEQIVIDPNTTPLVYNDYIIEGNIQAWQNQYDAIIRMRARIECLTELLKPWPLPDSLDRTDYYLFTDSHFSCQHILESSNTLRDAILWVESKPSEKRPAGLSKFAVIIERDSNGNPIWDIPADGSRPIPFLGAQGLYAAIGDIRKVIITEEKEFAKKKNKGRLPTPILDANTDESQNYHGYYTIILSYLEKLYAEQLSKMQERYIDIPGHPDYEKKVLKAIGIVQDNYNSQRTAQAKASFLANACQEVVTGSNATTVNEEFLQQQAVRRWVNDFIIANYSDLNNELHQLADFKNLAYYMSLRDASYLTDVQRATLTTTARVEIAKARSLGHTPKENHEELVRHPDFTDSPEEIELENRRQLLAFRNECHFEFPEIADYANNWLYTTDGLHQGDHYTVAERVPNPAAMVNGQLKNTITWQLVEKQYTNPVEMRSLISIPELLKMLKNYRQLLEQLRSSVSRQMYQTIQHRLTTHLLPITDSSDNPILITDWSAYNKAIDRERKLLTVYAAKGSDDYRVLRRDFDKLDEKTTVKRLLNARPSYDPANNLLMYILREDASLKHSMIKIAEFKQNAQLASGRVIFENGEAIARNVGQGVTWLQNHGKQALDFAGQKAKNVWNSIDRTLDKTANELIEIGREKHELELESGKWLVEGAESLLQGTSNGLEWLYHEGVEKVKEVRRGTKPGLEKLKTKVISLGKKWFKLK